MDTQEVRVKEEQIESAEMPQSEMADQFDYSRLYGDLCRKLLSTPVTEIFSETKTGNSPLVLPTNVISGIPQTNVTGVSEYSPISTFHAALPTMTADQMALFGGLYNQSGIFDTSEMAKKVTPKGKSATNSRRNSDTTEVPTEGNFYMDSMETIAQSHEPIDIQKLVDLFKVTLERYGVSQRFAARFIMQDTSQGNLSFLMEKGRVKKWEELSPRGRIPYIKMKAWLESKDLQLNTLHMLKYSQDIRRNSPKESFNRRERFSMFQLNVLCRLFEENPNPPMNIRNAVAERLTIPLDRVNVWFQNQRARGFPARRILQQHSDVYSDDNMKSDLDVAQEICQINKSQDSASSKAPRRSGPTTTPTSSPRNVGNLIMTEEPFLPKIEVYEPLLKIPNPADTCVPSQMQNYSQQVLPNDIPAAEGPLDLSASNNSPVVPTPPLVDDNLETRGNRRVSTETLNIKQPTPPLSGASKRKRGFKPQQIIQKSAQKPQSSEVDPKSFIYQQDDDLQQKRRRLSSAESVYDKRKETTCSSGSNSRATHYDYVIKTEPEFSGNSTETNPESYSNTENGPFLTSHMKREPGTSPRLENKCANTHGTKRPGSANSTEGIETQLTTSAINSEHTDDDKENSDTSMNVQPSTDDLLKAMCASIAMEKKSGTSGDSSLVEPELD